MKNLWGSLDKKTYALIPRFRVSPAWDPSFLGGAVNLLILRQSAQHQLQRAGYGTEYYPQDLVDHEAALTLATCRTTQSPFRLMLVTTPGPRYDR